MLLLWSIFLSSFVIGLSGALMPGPLLTVTISESTRRGARTGPMLVAGHGILELSLVIAVVLGRAPFLKQRSVFTVIAIAGALILLWMAWGMFRSLPRLSLSGGGESAAKRSLITSGILMSLANPYWAMWWVTIGLGYILKSQDAGPWGVVFFFAGHILADFVWYTSISTAVAKGKRLLNDTLYRAMIGVCAGFLVFFAVFVLYGAIMWKA